MDTHPHRPDDLTDLERQLSGWAPASGGLDSDAMLFAAGRASARPAPARFIWPALTGVLSVLVVVLGVWLMSERSERQLLAQQLRQAAPAPETQPSPAVVPTEPAREDLTPIRLHFVLRALEHGLDAWPTHEEGRVETPGPAGPNPRILQVGHLDTLLDQ